MHEGQAEEFLPLCPYLLHGPSRKKEEQEKTIDKQKKMKEKASGRWITLRG